GAAGRDGRGRARIPPGGARKPAGCCDCWAASPPGWLASCPHRPRGRLRPEADDGLTAATATAVRPLGRRPAPRSRRGGGGGEGFGDAWAEGGTAAAGARERGRGRTRREGAGPYPSRRRAETLRLFRLLGSIPTWLAGQLSPPAAGAATAGG